MKVCSKCSKVSHQENDVVNCGNWYENSIEKNSCIYWIHKNKDCCQTDSNVDYCPTFYKLLQSNINNDNSLSEINNNHRPYQSDDDDIYYSNKKGGNKYVVQTVISESSKKKSDKLNKKYSSASGTPPSTVVVVDRSSNILDENVEDENFEINSDIEPSDPSSTIVVYKKPTGIIEQNLTIDNGMIIDQKILRYVLRSIDILETTFPNFIEFESRISTIAMQNKYIMNYSGSEICYGELISNLLLFQFQIYSYYIWQLHLGNESPPCPYSYKLNKLV